MYAVDIKSECDDIVVTMMAMGATFHIHTGALGAETWTYDLEDESARQACRRLLASVDRYRIGFNSAFIAAIREAISVDLKFTSRGAPPSDAQA